MKRRRLWAVAGLDLVFLLLGSVLLAAHGFERGLGEWTGQLPRMAGASGSVDRQSRRLTVVLDGRSLRVDGQAMELERLDGFVGSVRRARELGADEAVVMVTPSTSVTTLLTVLDGLRRGGIVTVRLPVEKEE